MGTRACEAASTYFDARFRSRDRDETQHWLSGHFGLVDVGSRFAGYAEHVVGDDKFLLADATMFGQARCVTSTDVILISAGTPGSGWELGEEAGSFAAEPALFQPHRVSLHRMADTEGRVVGFRPEQLARTARQLYGQPELELSFDGPRPINARRAAMWLAALEVARNRRRAGALANDLVRAETYHQLAVAALETFRLTGERPTPRPSVERRARVFRAAARFLDDHASLPITIDDAAAAAGASVGEVVLAFRSHGDGRLGPAAYLRRARLIGAADELRSAGTSVREVAERWGFSCEESFLREYRREFGGDFASSEA
ncbi:helix-turn-helix domain-containing protein [Leifsonia sp. AG29]|uniref:helix-turn-helix domain-containing protein n=1 Tax=Leifsonia sp. AG29 TaxID=2598860 RepID=UPI00131E92E3|nr:helix-turn-helix domain-containing protein [Leifsonia sp. AG29]